MDTMYNIQSIMYTYYSQVDSFEIFKKIQVLKNVLKNCALSSRKKQIDAKLP